MNQIKVNKTHLIEKLKVNRDNHKAHYLKALQGWKEECLQKSKQYIDRLEKGDYDAVCYLDKRPKDMTKEYNTAINMLEWEQEDIIVVTKQQFMNYVEDNWDWSDNWTTANSKYIK